MNPSCALVFCALLLLAVRAGYCQQLLWQFTNDFPTAQFYSSPSVGDDGTIYLGSSGDSNGGHGLFALAPSGAKKWFFTNDSPVTTSATIGTNGNIYFGTFSGSMFALHPNGTLAWEYQTGAEHVRGVALAEDGTIYCTVRRYRAEPRDRARLCAINPDGTKRWEFTVPGEAYGAPIINLDGTIHWPTYDKFYAVNPDGTKYWEFPSVEVEGAAIGADGTIYVTTYIGEGNSRVRSLCGFNPDGTLEWASPASGSRLLVGLDETIYGCGGQLEASDAQGFPLWQTISGNSGEGVVSSDGTIYVLSSDGTGSGKGLIMAFGMNGGLKWQLGLPTEVFLSPALLPDGTMYVGGGKRLYAVKVPCGMANSPWPMSGHDLKRTGRAGTGQPVCPCLSAIRLAGNRGFQLTMVGEIGTRYRIETSTNLIAWSPWTGFVASNLVTHLADPGATNLSYRFYRAVSP